MTDQSDLTLKSFIRAIPDFPKPGVIFRDITPLFRSPDALQLMVKTFLQRYRTMDFTHLAAMDARGFLLGPLLAYELRRPLILFRKQGKLPGKCLSQRYQTEYGEAQLEVQIDSLRPHDRVVIIDDLIATGGTLMAGVSLVRQLHAETVEVAAIVDLPELGGSTRLQNSGVPTFSLTTFNLNEL